MGSCGFLSTIPTLALRPTLSGISQGVTEQLKSLLYKAHSR